MVIIFYQRIAKQHENCSKSESDSKNNSIDNKVTALTDGNGLVSSERRKDFNVETSPDGCTNGQNIDQSVKVSPKEIIVDSELAKSKKTITNESNLSVQTIVSQLRPRFQNRGRKILLKLLENPDDFGFDGNGIVTIFHDTIPGKNCLDEYQYLR